MDIPIVYLKFNSNIFNFKVKENQDFIFGVELASPEVFFGYPRIIVTKVYYDTSAEMCAETCKNVANCLMWRFNKKKKFAEFFCLK